MTTYNYTNDPNVVFNPNSDVLLIDTGTAADLFVSQVGTSVRFIGSGHLAILQNVTPGQLTSTNVKVQDGSVMLVGDNTIGTADDDLGNVLISGPGNDLLIGLGGNDSLDGGAGLDRIYGNTGDDSVRGSPGNDIVFGGQGNDIVDYFSQSGALQIYGNLGDDQLFGASGSDKIFGGQGNDSINGGNGDNLLIGGLGRDTLFGGDGNDRLEGGDGNDQLLPGLGNNAIYGNQGDDVIGGAIGATADVIFGGQGNDSILYQNQNADSFANIYGNLGDDSIQGSPGTDFIQGGQGNDSIRGNGDYDGITPGLGNDTLVVAVQGSGSDSGITESTSDIVVSFLTGSDKIRGLLGGTDVPGAANNYNEYADDNVASVGQAVTSYATQPDNNYTYIAGQFYGFLVIDYNKDGAADGVITFNFLLKATLADFAFTDII